VTPPDYAATMVTRAGFRPGSMQILHHGNWTRTVTATDAQRATYYPADDGGRIMVSDRSLSIVRGPEGSSLLDYEPRNTGERQTHLGESCTVWDVWRDKMRKPGESGNVHLSCVTDDGIELWHRTSSAYSVVSVEATQIERRPVSPDDIKPPSSAFVVDWPDGATLPPTVVDKPDHEVVMARRQSRENGSVRTVRRHGPWLFKEEIHGQLRIINIDHDSGYLLLRYSTDKSGAPNELVVLRSYPPERWPIPQPRNENDTVLGETCRWFNLTPGSEDGGASACLADDGIALKETFWYGVGHPSEWTAVRVARRPIALDEIKPPADLLSPKTWGVE